MGTAYTHKKPMYPDVDDRDDLYETRTPSSARRYRPQNTMDDPTYRPQGSTTLVQRRRSGTTATNARQITGVTGAVVPARNVTKTSSRTIDYQSPIYTKKKTAPRKHTSNKRFFWSMLMVGMAVTVALIIGSTFVSTWWQNTLDDWRYGNPRTYQMDVVVGHNDSQTNKTHLIFINLNGHVEFIEIPGGDPTHTRIFTGPILEGSNKDTIPVTGEGVKDPQTGRIDIVVHVADQQFLFVNNGTTFAFK